MAYRIQLLSKEMVADHTMSFHFKKPQGFNYLAGQYCDFTLINPSETDDEGDKRTFSLSSAPFEAELSITTRLRDTAFKRVLRNLPIGSELDLDGPFGSLTLPADATKPVVFLTGGIGCTFVRSIVTQATHDHAPHKLIFLYSNRSPREAAFLSEFAELAKQNPNFTFVPTMTDPGNEPWDGKQGAIDAAMIETYVGDIMEPIYYLSGPGAMAASLRTMLARAGVERYNLRSDLFIGY